MFRRTLAAVSAIVAAAFVCVVAPPNGSAQPSVSGASPVAPARSAGAATRPNIVFVLTDDLSWNLVRHMSHVVQLQRAGATMSRYYVVDSLCCPSRSSIFTGEYPHDNGVFTNVGSDGGYDKYNSEGNPQKAFAVSLHNNGYRTGMMGKYLNGYDASDPIPPGYDEWDVAGKGAYDEFDYDLNENGTTHHYGTRPQAYLTDVLSGKAGSFIDSAAQAKSPFMLEVAPFAPHKPYKPAPRYVGTARGLHYPRTPAYDTEPTSPPKWLKGNPPLSADHKQRINQIYRMRVEADQATNDLIGHIEARLRANHVAKDTYIVFSSDNGYHMGEYRLLPGKQTAFDTDIRVPLIVAGPHVVPGSTVDQLTSSIDLAPTFESLTGSAVGQDVDGVSLAGLWHGAHPSNWQHAILVEHHGPDNAKGDPDRQDKPHADPPSYEAIRTTRALYVRYVKGQREYYDTTKDPYELHNLERHGVPRHLRAMLVALEHCQGAASCQAAAGVAVRQPHTPQPTTVRIHPRARHGTISPLLLGGNGHWLYNDYGGWDQAKRRPYPAFVDALRRSAVTTVRYPAGTSANLFHWQRAIGPQAARRGQVGQTNGGFPNHALDSHFGPDEYGALSERLHQAGNIVVNFATGTPREAANWVEYMTGRVGQNRNGGRDWARVRARLGHPAPYAIPYWEVGNEAQLPHQLYWRAGRSTKDVTQLYAFGGRTRFTQQRVGTPVNYSAKAALSSGAANQRFVARYAPVVVGSSQVYVDGTPWTRVDSLDGAAATDQDYTLNGASGAIRFGDGTHGAIPAAGAVITISYVSGPHAGFDRFYAAMKRANPAVRVCASMADPRATVEFARLMGSTHPYDCLERHAYVNTTRTPIRHDLDPSQYHEELIAHVAGQVADTRLMQQAVDRYAGARAKQIKVVVTEYGHIGNHPDADPDYHQSLSEAILMGDDLVHWIKLGIPLADEANLNGYLDAPRSGLGHLVGRTPDAMIARSGRRFILNAKGLVPQLFTALVNGTRLGTETHGNPVRRLRDGKRVPALVVTASRAANGAVELLVVNADAYRRVTVTVHPGLPHVALATTSTLHGPSVTARNVPGNQQVRVTTVREHVGFGAFVHTFPAHSITRIELTPLR